MESEVVKYILEEIKDIKNRIVVLSEKINSIEKDIVQNVSRIKYYNGKFEETFERLETLEKFKSDSSVVLNRLNSDVLDNMINLCKTTSRYGRIWDTILASVISGVLVSVITGLILYFKS